ncbi:MAG: hypothetical protein HY343_00620 [Lentisphaerae bacterium]|nr:hypothetical protein [Lentisphaerota bacterium]
MPNNNFKERWAPRLLILALTSVFGAILVRFPCWNLNSDTVIFGLMGNHILRDGYWTTLAYGQNYLFSITPYVYALVRWVMPETATPMLVLRIAGTLLSLAGLWLLFESFLRVQRRTGRPRWPAALIFCLLIASSSRFLFVLAENSSIEMSLFVLGILFYSAARIEEGLAANARLRQGAWLMFGLATTLALISRPQVFLYGLVMAPLLFVRTWSVASVKGRCLVFTAFLLGGFAGYVPMLLHNIFRAPTWPYAYVTDLIMATGKDVAHALSVFFVEGGIYSKMLGIHRQDPVVSALAILWSAAAAAGFLWFALRRRKDVSALDIAWVAGSSLIMIVMMCVPTLAVDSSAIRYCLQTFVGMVWLFSRFAVPAGPRWLLPLALAAMVLAFSAREWERQLTKARNEERDLNLAIHAVIPELKSHHAVILTGYWDAYLLRFLSDETLPVEPFPWQYVRTYGAIGEDNMNRKTAWLICKGYGHDTWNRLEARFGKPFMQTIQTVPIRAEFCQRRCELWTFEDPTLSARMMRDYHPLYFRVSYPPRP